jgi:hypothetical protein
MHVVASPRNDVHAFEGLMLGVKDDLKEFKAMDRHVIFLNLSFIWMYNLDVAGPLK